MEVIDGQITKVDINKQGVQKKGMQVRKLGAVYEFEKPSYPDFIRRLQDSTQLLRTTIIEVVANSGRIDGFIRILKNSLNKFQKYF